METKKSLRLANGSWDFQNDPMFKKYLHLIDEVVDEGRTSGIFDKDYPNDWWCYLKEGYGYDGQTIIHEPTRRRVIDCLKSVYKVQEEETILTSPKGLVLDMQFDIPKNWPKKVKDNVLSITLKANGTYWFMVKGYGEEFHADSTAEMLRTCKELVECLEIA
jgi:hypothetical protein